MSQFKQMFEQAANLFNSDDEVHVALAVVVTKDGKMHTLTDVRFPMHSMMQVLRNAADQIAKEKLARLEAPAETLES